MDDKYVCGKCEAFVPFPDGNGGGTCRRRPPTPVVLNFYSDSLTIDNKVIQVLKGSLDGSFPATNVNWGCLDFVPAMNMRGLVPQQIPEEVDPAVVN